MRNGKRDKNVPFPFKITTFIYYVCMHVYTRLTWNEQKPEENLCEWLSPLLAFCGPWSQTPVLRPGSRSLYPLSILLILFFFSTLKTGSCVSQAGFELYN